MQDIGDDILDRARRLLNQPEIDINELKVLKEFTIVFKNTVDEMRKLQNEGFARVEDLSKEQITQAILFHVSSLNISDLKKFHASVTEELDRRLTVSTGEQSAAKVDPQNLG